jgi:hypothetical protein
LGFSRISLRAYDRAMAVETNAHPFQRWAGDKRWLAQRLPGLLEEVSFGIYRHPFHGGGSVFLSKEIFDNAGGARIEPSRTNFMSGLEARSETFTECGPKNAFR